MRTRTIAISFAAALVSVSLVAQEPPRSKGASLMERFKQLDRNGDGKLSREEGRSLTNFDEMDVDRDGSLTPQEIGTFYKPKGSCPFPSKP